jgi:hypothetical protein
MWTAEETEDILGPFDADPGLVTVKSFGARTDPSWPLVLSPYKGKDVTWNGPRMLSTYLAAGPGNAKLIAGLYALEKTLLTNLSQRLKGGTPTELDPGFGYENARDWLPAYRGDSARSEAIASLLRDTLLRTLVDSHGFALVPGGDVKRPLRFLDDNEFYEPVRLQQHMKDVTVGVEHGEWTHLLQWYLLSISPPAEPGVTFSPAELFKYLGYQAAHQVFAPQAGLNKGPTLWYVCCDRNAVLRPVWVPRAKSRLDFRCPDNLHVFLAGCGDERLAGMKRHFAGNAPALNELDAWAAQWTTSRDKWPFLCALLRRRVEKRDKLFAQADLLQSSLGRPETLVAMLKSQVAGSPQAAGTINLGTDANIATFLSSVPADPSGVAGAAIDWSLIMDVSDADAVALQASVLALLQGTRRLQSPDGPTGVKALPLLYVWTKSSTSNRLNLYATPPDDPATKWTALAPTERTALLATASKAYLD